MQKQLWIRVVVTALVAWPIALLLCNDSWSFVGVGIVCWIVLYWLWNVGDRHGRSITRPLWPGVARRVVVQVAGAVALTVIMAVLMMILDLRQSEKQIRAARDMVRTRMTISDVLSLVHGDFNIRAHAVLPDSVTDEELLHYANLMRQRNGEFVCLCGTKNELQNLTGSEAAELMKQKMSDGYDWRWRYTFVTATPRHFSFTVTFGRDGRVKDITDVWGWD